MNGWDEIAPRGDVDLERINPRYFVTPSPANPAGVERRQTRMYPAMSEESAKNLPGFLGVRGVIGGPNQQSSISRGGLTGSDPREWLS